MSAIPSWLADPTSWDTLYFGAHGAAAPGIARVMPTHKNKVQKNAGPGINGGSIVDQGADLTDFKIELMIWTEEQWDQLTKLLAIILPTVTPKIAHTVAHPVFAAYKCSQIYVGGFSGGMPVDQMVKFTMDAFRWVKPKPKSVSAKVVADAPTATFASAASPSFGVPPPFSPFVDPAPTDGLPPISLRP